MQLNFLHVRFVHALQIFTQPLFGQQLVQNRFQNGFLNHNLSITMQIEEKTCFWQNSSSLRMAFCARSYSNLVDRYFMQFRNCSMSLGVAVITSPVSLSMVCLFYLMLGLDLITNCLLDEYLLPCALTPQRIDVWLILLFCSINLVVNDNLL